LPKISAINQVFICLLTSSLVVCESKKIRHALSSEYRKISSLTILSANAFIWSPISGNHLNCIVGAAVSDQLLD
jgi:hypothetical protein